MLISALALLLVLGGVGWWKQDFFQEQYHRRMVMRPNVLTPEQEKAKAAQPKTEFRECETGCPEMVVIPGGKFMMGESNAAHEVAIAKPFAVSKFEVTFGQWDNCVAAGACQLASDGNWGRDTRPVINLSWADARSYAAWLSRMTGKQYRLLSEAEWEYVARAGTSTVYSWGDDIGKGNANCDGCGSQWDNKQTAPVGSFQPNAFGLYDMHGNVWEWTDDCWNRSYEGAPKDGSSWTSGDCKGRVVRGGSWVNNPQNLRSAIRDRDTTVVRDNLLGFRLARTLHP